MNKSKLIKKWENALVNERRVRIIRESKLPEIKKLNDELEKMLQLMISDSKAIDPQSKYLIINKWQDLYDDLKSVMKNKSFNEIDENLDLSICAAKMNYIAQLVKDLKNTRGLEKNG